MRVGSTVRSPVTWAGEPGAIPGPAMCLVAAKRRQDLYIGPPALPPAGIFGVN